MPPLTEVRNNSSRVIHDGIGTSRSVVEPDKKLIQHAFMLMTTGGLSLGGGAIGFIPYLGSFMTPPMRFDAARFIGTLPRLGSVWSMIMGTFLLLYGCLSITGVSSKSRRENSSLDPATSLIFGLVGMGCAAEMASGWFLPDHGLGTLKIVQQLAIPPLGGSLMVGFAALALLSWNTYELLECESGRSG